MPICPDGRQIAAARALIGISQSQLAQETGLNVDTIHLIEGGDRTPRKSTMALIVDYFEQRGVRFSDDDILTGVVGTSPIR